MGDTHFKEDIQGNIVCDTKNFIFSSTLSLIYRFVPKILWNSLEAGVEPDDVYIWAKSCIKEKTLNHRYLRQFKDYDWVETAAVTLLFQIIRKWY